ncbi:protein-tyrosine phosphatase [Metarhizium album ARSEF 1941]|uniref:Protein-tyrosine phosphatase n=1 Tax=Metarhizium album (strain ARSEF 1941) TaxID=1081103 RepID=A0A0B2WKF9_METAS|nr:protein-tyrosine phosphatase [Metarhizium album ARSEF 1941]KHN94413.1 protein-tyrosine phosphatase [Metarhizium album ARSEF 1941]
MAPHSTAWLVIPQGDDGVGSPSDLRGQGGISNTRLPAPGEEALDAEWRRLRDIRVEHSEDNIDFEDLIEILLFDLSNYGDDRLRRRAWSYIDPRMHPRAPASRVWIYEIATAPNMLLHNGPSYHGVEYFSFHGIGGIVWSQVVRFAELSLSHTGIRDHVTSLTDQDPSFPSWMSSVEFTWMQNPDYNSQWERYGAMRGLPSDIFDNPRGTTRVQLARELMRVATSSQIVPDQRDRETLRQLLDWDVEREPDRNFPLIRHVQPPRLDASALSRLLPQIDWSTVQIPTSLQIALASGLANAVQCDLALQPFKDWFFSRGSRGRKRQAQKPACDQLGALIKDMKDVPKPCQKIKNIEFGFTLAANILDIGEGTWDDVGGTLEGPAGKAEFKIAEEPAAGFSTWVPVHMRSGSSTLDTVDITGITQLTLNAEGFWLREGRNDQFLVQDIKIRAECADPRFVAQDNRYVGINHWYGHPDNWKLTRKEKKTVATLPIALKDWKFAPPCAALKDLEYSFKVGGGPLHLFAGTDDKVSFTLGKGKPVLLGEGFSSGFDNTVRINLSETFGKDTVDIRDLDKLEIWDEKRTYSVDEWWFQGITFKGTCAESSIKVEMTTFRAVDQEVGYQVGTRSVGGGNMNTFLALAKVALPMNDDFAPKEANLVDKTCRRDGNEAPWRAAHQMGKGLDTATLKVLMLGGIAKVTRTSFREELPGPEHLDVWSPAAEVNRNEQKLEGHNILILTHWQASNVIKARKMNAMALLLACLGVVLALFGVALYEHIYSTTLSLPISPAVTIVTALLPLAAATNMFFHPRLARSDRHPARLLGQALQGGQAILTTVLATILFSNILPSAARDCLLSTVWQRLFSGHDAASIRRIQDALNCCGFHTVRDRAWPFPNQHTSQQCAETYKRDMACIQPWRAALQMNSGIGFGVVLFIGIIQIASLISRPPVTPSRRIPPGRTVLYAANNQEIEGVSERTRLLPAAAGGPGDDDTADGHVTDSPEPRPDQATSPAENGRVRRQLPDGNPWAAE